MDTVIFGDSLAGDYGIAPEKAWSQLLAGDRVNEIRHVIWKNGYTSAQLLECLNREIIKVSPKRVLLICGSNDALRGRDASSILSTAGFMIRTLQDDGINAIWLLPPLMDETRASVAFGDPPVIYQRANQTLRRLREAVDRTNLPIIDLEILRREFLSDEDDCYTDGLHFNLPFQRFLAHRLKGRLFQ